jgi:predicted nucleotidyltransferase
MGVYETPAYPQIQAFIDATQSQLGELLVGIYLHGSLAMGCFNPQRSDIDLLVVTTQRLMPTQKRAIAQMLLSLSNQPHPFELSILAWDDLHPWRHPTPYDFHYSEDWRTKLTNDLANGAWQSWQHTDSGDPDLAGHVMITRKRGICLFGMPIAAVFPEVPEADYTASICADIAWAWACAKENPVYFVLNLCRTLAWLRENHVFSKEEGAIWAFNALPSVYHASIQQALKIYRTENNDFTQNIGDLSLFTPLLQDEKLLS